VKVNWSTNLVKLVACVVVVSGTCGGAFASCGEAFNAIAAQAKALGAVQAWPASDDAPSGRSSSQTIVGMWHVQFLVDGSPIQEAYQIWNLGGTEVHNPNVDPRGGNVCLGAWTQAAANKYKLVHRVWSYDTSGNFLGTVHLTEYVWVSKSGKHHQGEVTLDFYDPSGKFQQEVKAQVVADRVAGD